MDLQKEARCGLKRYSQHIDQRNGMHFWDLHISGDSLFLLGVTMDKIFIHDIKILENVSARKKKKPTWLIDLTVIGTLTGMIVLFYILWAKN